MADIVVLAALVLKPALDALAPDFMRATGHRLKIEYGSATAIRDRIAAKTEADIAIIQRPALEQLATGDAIVPDDLVTLARSGVAVAIPTGAPKPDLSTLAAVERVLREARSIAYPDPANGHASGIHFQAVLEQLGLCDAVRPRTTLMPGALTDFAAQASHCKVDIAITQPMEILATPGYELAGWLPPELQDAEAFTWAMGVCAKSAEPAAARDLIRYLASPEAARVIEAKGMAPAAA